jgi:3-dehydroquinate dehydratase-2
MRLLLVHGPNLNRLGHRDPTMYGRVTLAEIVAQVTAAAQPHGYETVEFQSNHEGQLIDWLQENFAVAHAIIINPGGLSHTSVSLRDALDDTKLPVVEVHLSDPAKREEFRRVFITATAAKHVIAGKGAAGYLEAVEWIAANVAK